MRDWYRDRLRETAKVGKSALDLFVLITSILQEFHEKPVEERKEAMQAGKREERLADTSRV